MRYLDFFRGSVHKRVARQFIEVLRAAGEHRRLEYDADNQLVVAFDEHGDRVQLRFIGNLLREISAAGRLEHAAILRRYALSSLGDSEDACANDYQVARPTLRVLLKDDSYPAYMALLNQHDFPDAKQSSLVFEPLAGDVIACCIEDRGHALRFVTEDDLAKWGIDAATALADAKSNVRSLPYTISETSPARYVFNDDSFQASRLINPQMFEGLPVRGEWVAVVPDRDTFFVADSEDLDGVAALGRLIERQLQANERLISAMPFVLRRGTWQPYEVRGASHAAFANVLLKYRASAWAAYKGVLEKVFRVLGQEIFVASFTVREDEGAEVHHSMTVWSRGVDTILPVVERVYFYDGTRKATHSALWADVTRVMGVAMHQENGLPNRYRVNSFPTPEQLLAMGARTI